MATLFGVLMYRHLWRNSFDRSYFSQTRRYRIADNFRDNYRLCAIVFVILYPYLLATGQCLASRVKYDRLKQFFHTRLYISTPNNAAILLCVTSLWIKSITFILKSCLMFLLICLRPLIKGVTVGVTIEARALPLFG